MRRSTAPWLRAKSSMPKVTKEPTCSASCRESVTLHKGSVVVASLGPNDVFGERALIDHLPRNLTAIATGKTTLAEIDRRDFLFLFTNHPRSPWAS